MEKQVFEFDKEINKNSKNRKAKKSSLKRLGGVLKIAVVTFLITVLVSTFVACDFFGGKENTNKPNEPDSGIVVPGEDGNESGDENGNQEKPTEPEDPEDPDDPDKPIDPIEPEDPTKPDPDPEPEPEPEPEPDPDPKPDPSDEPKDITEVDEIDEINKFGDEAIKILNKNYLDGIALKLIGKGMTADDFENAVFEWMIVDYENEMINQLQVKVHYTRANGDLTYFQVGKVVFNKGYSINDILNNNIQDVVYSSAFRSIPGISTKNIPVNAPLGNLVINKVNGTNIQNQGDIWCSIGSVFPEAGKEYRPITVYQISNNQVQKYELIVEAPTIKVDEIMQNINDGKFKGKGSCTTEYTFEGLKIEQESNTK